MSELYVKNKKGEFIPINISSVLNKDLNNKLIVVSVGSESSPATEDDLNETIKSFAKAKIIDITSASIIITPYQIKIEALNKSEIENKHICLQITHGDNVNELEDWIRKIYESLSKSYNVAVIPTPLTTKEYNKVLDIMRLCKLRKSRRRNVRK